jgi:GGDEF domain-containing protein
LFTEDILIADTVFRMDKDEFLILFQRTKEEDDSILVETILEKLESRAILTI